MTIKEIIEATKNRKTLVWNDPDPIIGADYTITCIESLYQKDEDTPIYIRYGAGSEAEVLASEISIKTIAFSEEMLINSKEFKEWVTGRVQLIHNTYWDSKEPYQVYIVLHSDELGKITITRFFKSIGRIYVSQDHTGLSSQEVYKVLLTEYSRGLK